jgi:hypothetical protein
MNENVVVEWARPNLNRKDIFDHPKRHEVAKFLTEHGANLERAKLKPLSVKKWTNAGNKDFMEAVWGDNYKRYKAWAENYIHQYQAITYENQPKLETSGSVSSGAIRVLCLLTKFAVDTSFTNSGFSQELDVRRLNGVLRSQGKKRDELRTLTRPDTKEVYHPGSFPPDFLNALVFEIETWKK